MRKCLHYSDIVANAPLWFSTINWFLARDLINHTICPEKSRQHLTGPELCGWVVSSPED